MPGLNRSGRKRRSNGGPETHGLNLGRTRPAREANPGEAKTCGYGRERSDVCTEWIQRISGDGEADVGFGDDHGGAGGKAREGPCRAPR